MTDSQPEKITGETLDISEQRKQELKQLFPGAFTETTNDKGEVVETIDFEKLKAELGSFSDVYEGRRERYGMEWPGKRDCMKLIQQPSRATLKPCREESVDFETTQNLFIEGDNLEVLKLLQKSYYGKVKMIYIDPPYNTGKEFIYPDNYQESLETYMAYAGLVDDEGKKFSSNTATEGRFHTKWLNMMYPRLYLARNLLREDGVIFVSIDYREASNLRRILDEIFGEENLVFDVTVVNNLKGRNDREGIATCHEQLMIYCRPEYVPRGLALSADKIKEYSESDEVGGAFQWRDLRKRGGADTRKERPNMYFPLYVCPNDFSVAKEVSEKHSIEVYPTKSDGEEGCWRWGKNKVYENISILKGSKVANKDRWNISYKVYLNSDDGQRRGTPKSIWTGSKYSTDSATKSLAKHFPDIDAKKFTPKPVGLLMDIIDQSCEEDDIVLDYFSGTGTIAEALFLQNSIENLNRSFIAIQLPEKIEEGLPDSYSSIKTISDLAKERIRRTSQKIHQESEGQLDLEGRSNLDLGFKVLKLDQSNFKQWQTPSGELNADQIGKTLDAFANHIDPYATQEEILYELLLKAGFMPTEKVETLDLAGKQVFSIAGGALLICLEDELTAELIDAVADLEPMQFICLDKAFNGNDQLKANAVQTFKSRSQNAETEMVFKVV